MPKLTDDSRGLEDGEIERIELLIDQIGHLIEDVGDLRRHRCYSLAITKLEEAQHWLEARTRARAEGM